MSTKKPRVGLKAELRNARETKHLLYATNTHAQAPVLDKSSNSIVWDLKYTKPRGADQHKIDAPPNVIERLLRDKVNLRMGGSCAHAELLRLFRHYDKDGSGQIELDEFKKMMSAFNILLTHKAAKGMFQKYDTGGDGTISFQEFKKAVMLQKDPREPDPVPVCPGDFGPKEIDHMTKAGGRGMEITEIDWHTGKINASPAHIEKVLRQKLQERTGVAANVELRRSWKLFDPDGSKQISIQEFEQVLKSFNLNLTNKKLREMFDRYDVNGNGFIDQAEFEAGVLNGRLPRRGELGARSFAGNQDLTDQSAHTSRGKMGPLLKTGGLFLQTRAGLYEGDTPEAIERTLRTKLRERSVDSPHHELHRIWQHYDKDFDHRVDINEFRQVLVAFNIHPSEQCLQRLFDRYSEKGNGLVERQVFEDAVLNGNMPKGGLARAAGRRSARSKTSMALRGHMDAQADQQGMLKMQQTKLESQARETLDLLKQAKAVNTRVLQMQDSLEGRRSSRSSMPRTGRTRTGRSSRRSRISTPLGLEITGGSY